MTTITDIPFLTRLRPQYAQFLTMESKRRKTSKKDIIDDMFALYIEVSKKQKLEDAYRSMAMDDEYLAESQNLANNHLSHL